MEHGSGARPRVGAASPACTCLHVFLRCREFHLRREARCARTLCSRLFDRTASIYSRWCRTMTTPFHDVRGYTRTLEADPGLLRDVETSADTAESISLSEDGAALVRDFENFLTRYVILPEHTALPLVLWV